VPRTDSYYNTCNNSCTTQIAVQDVGSDTKEVLEFARDRVVEMALGHGHLVVATATQCFIYAVTNWNTPHIFDLRGAVSLLALAPRHFLTVDALAGVQVVTRLVQVLAV
jgi:intraflagellar transport protein 80